MFPALLAGAAVAFSLKRNALHDHRGNGRVYIWISSGFDGKCGLESSDTPYLWNAADLCPDDVGRDIGRGLLWRINLRNCNQHPRYRRKRRHMHRRLCHVQAGQGGRGPGGLRDVELPWPFHGHLCVDCHYTGHDQARFGFRPARVVLPGCGRTFPDSFGQRRLALEWYHRRSHRPSSVDAWGKSDYRQPPLYLWPDVALGRRSPDNLHCWYPCLGRDDQAVYRKPHYLQNRGNQYGRCPDGSKRNL